MSIHNDTATGAGETAARVNDRGMTIGAVRLAEVALATQAELDATKRKLYQANETICKLRATLTRIRLEASGVTEKSQLENDWENEAL